MDFATLHFDTYKVVQLLQSKGYTKDEAEGFIQAIQEVTLSGVATKQDILNVKTDIEELDKKIIKGLSDNIKFQIIHTITIIGVMIALSQML